VKTPELTHSRYTVVPIPFGQLTDKEIRSHMYTLRNRRGQSLALESGADRSDELFDKSYEAQSHNSFPLQPLGTDSPHYSVAYQSVAYLFLTGLSVLGLWLLAPNWLAPILWILSQLV
jgi:hypothetical protein